jgi:hypothetical protein
MGNQSSLALEDRVSFEKSQLFANLCNFAALKPISNSSAAGLRWGTPRSPAVPERNLQKKVTPRFAEAVSEIAPRPERRSVRLLKAVIMTSPIFGCSIFSACSRGGLESVQHNGAGFGLSAERVSQFTAPALDRDAM